MKLSDAYQSLTAESKKQVVADIYALCKSRNIRASESYISGVVRGCREFPCSVDLARLISGHFMGQIGIVVTVDDVLQSYSPKEIVAKPGRSAKGSKKIAGVVAAVA